MKSNQLYFYRKTMPMTMEEREKRGCKYYHQTLGIAGFTRPQSNMIFYLTGTIDDLAEYLKVRKTIKRTEEDIKYFQGGVS